MCAGRSDGLLPKWNAADAIKLVRAHALIRNGENIYCVEVEQVLQSHPDIAVAALIGRPHSTCSLEFDGAQGILLGQRKRGLSRFAM